MATKEPIIAIAGLPVKVTGNNAVVRNTYNAESELDGKTNTTKIGVLLGSVVSALIGAVVWYRSGGFSQGVVFPSPGWGRDFYWSSMGRLARVSVQHA